MTNRVGLRSLAVSFPRAVRTNEYFRARFPDEVERASANLGDSPWAQAADARRENAYDDALARYLHDPFRGTVERRVLGEGESALTLELRAAQRALAAAELDASDIDLLLVGSFLPDQAGVGNAAFLARALGTCGAAWNVESACSGALVGLETAAALLATGRYETALVVVSCAYSRVTDDASVLSWSVGDGAGAFVLTLAQGDEGLLGLTTVNTSATCETFYFEPRGAAGEGPALTLRGRKDAGRVLRATSEHYLREACDGALFEAGLSASDIDFFVCNTPTAWFASFAATALGIDPARTIDAYPLCGNVGPALLTANLHLAATRGAIKPGDKVLLYTIGSVSTASAAVLRWGDVRLGPADLDRHPSCSAPGYQVDSVFSHSSLAPSFQPCAGGA